MALEGGQTKNSTRTFALLLSVKQQSLGARKSHVWAARSKGNVTNPLCPVYESLPPIEALASSRDAAYTRPSELQGQHNVRSNLCHEKTDVQTIFFFKEMKNMALRVALI